MTNARLPVALVVVATMTGIATSACSSSDPRGHPSSQVAIPDSTSTSTTSGTRQGPTTLRLHRTVVAHGIRSPWGLAFLPDNQRTEGILAAAALNGGVVFQPPDSSTKCW